MVVTFGQWLRQRRKARGWSQEELARHVGCSAVLIRKIERNERRPSREVAELILGQLMGEGDDREALLDLARVPLFSQASSVSEASASSNNDPDATSQPLSPFTQREDAIWKLILDDLPDGVIAERLSLKLSTVRWYVKQIYSKLGVHSRDEALFLGGEIRPAHDLAEPPDFSYHSTHNLPAQTTRFVGREPELQDLVNLLDGEARLVTVLGMGGMGKTRIAQEAAARLLQEGCFPHGVWFVSLAAITTPDAIPQAIAEAINYQFQNDKRTPVQELLGYFANRTALLVLDNFEHVLTGATLVSDLLQAAPGLKALATSRERLALQEETIFRLMEMGYPADEALSDNLDYSAVQLFVNTARRVRPDFGSRGNDLSAVVRICRMVDGMPLGVMLAAAWADQLRPEVIADQIEASLDFLETEARNVPERQRSVRATFAYSYRLLSDAERATLSWLSVFRGSFDRAAAGAVVQADFRTLAKLVNKSLLQLDPDTGRYILHELLRQYLEQELDVAGQSQAARDSHSAYYLNFVAEREADLKGRRQGGALDEIEAELTQIHVAWAYAVEARRWERLNAAIEALYWFCQFRGFGHFFADLHTNIHKSYTDDPDPASRWVITRMMLRALEPPQLALEQLEASLFEAERRGDQFETGFCLLRLGMHRWRTGQQDEAIKFCQRCVAIFDSLRVYFYVGVVYVNLGSYLLFLGDLDASAEITERSIAAFRECGEEIYITAALHNASIVEMRRGSHDTFDRIQDEIFAIRQQLGDRAGIAESTVLMARRKLLQRDFGEARRLAAEGLQRADELNALLPKARALKTLGDIEIVEHEAYAEAVVVIEQARAIMTGLQVIGPTHEAAYTLSACYFELGELDNAVARWKDYMTSTMFSRLIVRFAQYQSDALALSALLRSKTRMPEAVELLAAASKFDDVRRNPIASTPPFSRLRARLEAAVDAPTFASAWQRGQNLDPVARAKALIDEACSL